MTGYLLCAKKINDICTKKTPIYKFIFGKYEYKNIYQYYEPHYTYVWSGNILIPIYNEYATYYKRYETLEEANNDKQIDLRYCFKCKQNKNKYTNCSY